MALNRTNLSQVAPSWVSEPDGRGTWNILHSCLATLLLCLYAALHINVGPDGETTFQWWIHKFKWVGIAMLSPELVLYSAGKQWFSARRLRNKLNRLLETYAPDPATIEIEPFWAGAVAPPRARPIQEKKKPRYTMVYGHFAMMGGFVVDVRHLHNSLSRLTISPKGVYFLAKHGHFLRISESAIKDKSKADLLAKLLVCIQVTWMLVQTIGRKAAHLPITLLELHTLVHVACALAMYVLWFQKPMDVHDPTWVDASGFQDLLALMLVRNYGLGNKVHIKSEASPVSVKSVDISSQTGSESSYLTFYRTRVREPSVEGTTLTEDETTIDPKLSRRKPRRKLGESPPEIITHHVGNGFDYALNQPKDNPTCCSLTSGQALSCGIGPAMRVHPLQRQTEPCRFDGRLSIPLSENDILRWNLAATALNRLGEDLHTDHESINYFTTSAPNIFINRKGLQAGLWAYFRAWASGGLVAALVMNAFYGATHLSAWNFEFPTSTEHFLWKIACIDTVAGTASLLALFSVIVYLHEHGWKNLKHAIFVNEPGIMPWLYRLIIFVGLLNTPFYLLSRLFIIVETFVSLRRVPWGVYSTVEWAEYIPHL